MLNLFFVSIIWGAWLQFVTVANQGMCRRHVQFTSETDGYALEGHVIQNLTLPMDIYNPCRGQCVMDDRCVSINIGPPINDHVVCELSDSDRSLHPEDLKPREGSTYTGTENACSSNPCFHNATCLYGFTDKGYICVCQTGYTGENCEIGCQKDEALGMESGKIINPQITASSQYSPDQVPFRARLNKQVEGDGMKGGWSAANNDSLQWIQVDFGDKATVKRVATQGRDDSSQWVTKYKLQYRDDGQTFHTYNKEFNGNSDQNTIVYNKLEPPIKARFVRLQPVAWKGHISLRMEFYGCKDCAEAIGDVPCKVLSTDCNVAGNDRKACGYGGVTSVQCETRGCCFNDTDTSGVPWCFPGGLKVT